MSRKPPPVSDHAVLRYLQRVAGVDVEGIRNRIWEQSRAAVSAGANRATVGGIQYRFSSGRVVTVVAVTVPEPRSLEFGARPRRDGEVNKDE